MNIRDKKDLIEEIKKKKKKFKKKKKKKKKKKTLWKEKNINQRKTFSLSIFIANMESRFKELSVLKTPLSEQEKIDYLYNSLPDDLALRSNAINFQGTFEKFSELLIRTN